MKVYNYISESIIDALIRIEEDHGTNTTILNISLIQKRIDDKTPLYEVMVCAPNDTFNSCDYDALQNQDH